MIIAHPPCTDLAVSGAEHFAAKIADGRQQRSIDFFMLFANHPCQRIAIENPIGIMSTKWRKPDQIVHPFHFGDPHEKATCLWLKKSATASVYQCGRTGTQAAFPKREGHARMVLPGIPASTQDRGTRESQIENIPGIRGRYGRPMGRADMTYSIPLKWHYDLMESGAVALGFPWSWTVFYVVMPDGQ